MAGPQGVALGRQQLEVHVRLGLRVFRHLCTHRNNFRPVDGFHRSSWCGLGSIPLDLPLALIRLRGLRKHCVFVAK